MNDHLIWAIVIGAVAAAINAAWTPQVPPALLWVSWIGFAAAIVLFIRWWWDVIR